MKPPALCGGTILFYLDAEFFLMHLIWFASEQYVVQRSLYQWLFSVLLLFSPQLVVHYLYKAKAIHPLGLPSYCRIVILPCRKNLLRQPVVSSWSEYPVLPPGVDAVQ